MAEESLKTPVGNQLKESAYKFAQSDSVQTAKQFADRAVDTTK